MMMMSFGAMAPDVACSGCCTATGMVFGQPADAGDFLGNPTGLFALESLVPADE